MNILELLEGQMDLLMKTGQTTPTDFRRELETRRLLNPLPEPLDLKDEISSLQKVIRTAAPQGKLSVKGTEFTFEIGSLDRLRSPKWSNDELILLCLHLAHKHSDVRVGFVVPLHQQVNSAKLMAKPFERVASQIEKWNAVAQNLTCFFPLNLHNNHFSLLEINYKTGVIHYYDFLGERSEVDVQVRSQN